LSYTARRHGCNVIVLGHQLEDQIETVLIRLGRGTGPRGLCGIAWRRPGAVDTVRPLLDCRRETLASYLRGLQQPWREDPSNRDATRTRNRVRHELLPALEHTFGAGSLESWADSLEDMRTLWELLSLAATDLLMGSRRRSLLHERGRIELCDVAPLRKAPSAVCGAALHRWFESVGCVNLRRQHIRAALRLVRNGQSGQQVGLPGGASVWLEQDSVVVAAARVDRRPRPAGRVDFETAKTSAGEPGAIVADPESRLVVEITHDVPGRDRMVRESVRVSAPDALPAELVAWVDADAAAPQPWIVRTPQAGERVRLLGAPGSRKLARVLQDSRIPHRLRHAWPIVADAEGIIWVPGIGVAERLRVHAETSCAARLTLRTQSADRAAVAATRAAAARAAAPAPEPADSVPSPGTPAMPKPTPRATARPTAWGG
jgi:tRNA(Ile)-lysidine synthase